MVVRQQSLLKKSIKVPTSHMRHRAKTIERCSVLPAHWGIPDFRHESHMFNYRPRARRGGGHIPDALVVNQPAGALFKGAAMGMSRQATFTLGCAMSMAVIVPGAAGYLSGRLEAVELAKRDLRALQEDIRARDGKSEVIAVPLCKLSPRQRRAAKKAAEERARSRTAFGPGTLGQPGD
jgi:hypothetical protein